MRLAPLIISILLLACEPSFGDDAYPGYTWEEVVDGVYLHRAIDPLASPVDGNSVIIDSGSGLIVVDTHINPAVARAIVAHVQSNLGKPVTHIVNTHWHDDHVNGNYVWRDAYPNAEIVAHRATLDALRNEWARTEKGRQEAYARVESADILAAAASLADPEQAMGYRIYAGYVAALKPELPALRYVYPDTVFEDLSILSSGNRRVELHWLGRGNTDGDVVVWLPIDKVLVTGDLLVAPVPFAFDSPLVEWSETLNRIRKFDADTIIPGHGSVQRDYDYLEKVRELILATLDAVRVAHEDGVAFEDIHTAVDLSDYQSDFVAGDADKAYAWQNYFLSPGLESAWISLGHPSPETKEPDLNE